ncbi:GNAT family N-acetyltransferase [Kribbella sandramycini]|uniref:GNAT family N-acetyltransferase n=1 Tax=Kribbella sandramycini TaxID=60450 RepID=A0A7Y4P3Y8_9ACTN|nr:GNAT family N-acetyltransferase [Kribbella sandramycini]MBB6566863.1 RimJ/RimL family protein N-acetyltransferase [Kribbella sandramycini]NOL44585.1 GNAT family N-acetyltransferase [Kribbella sandramycini]
MRFPEDVPQLADDLVRLRAHRADDLDDLYLLCQDPAMQRWTVIPVPYQRSDAEFFLSELVPNGWRAEHGERALAIEVDGRFSGSVSLHGGEGGVGEVGFSVAPWVRGRGVMTRAARLAIRYAFDELGWQRVIWRAYVGNWASRRVAWKLGFRGLVVVPGEGLARGVRYDDWVATLARDEEMAPQGNWWAVPELDGGTFKLRAFRPTDAQRVQEACNDERTQYWLAGLPAPYTLDDAKGFIEGRLENAASGEGVSFAIADPVTDELLGCVSLYDLNNRLNKGHGEIGYWMHPAGRGRKVMTNAVRLLVDHAFTPIDAGGLGRSRLLLLAAVENTASVRVAEANGMHRIGIARAEGPTRDRPRDDSVMFDLLVTDPRP